MDTINYGIDLGTSNSAIAGATGGTAELFRDTNGLDTLPSAVAFEAGRQVVGAQAYQRQWKSGAVAVRFKRALGTNQTWTLAGADHPLRAEDLSAAVLMELKRLAALKGHTVEHAVLCTPAKFSAAQCEGTNEAARLAGIVDPVLISEPMAASFGYGFTHEKKGAWIVYDLGAGTFDAVVVRVFEGRMQPQVPEGDNRCGGSDMDRILWDEMVVPKICAALGIAADHPALARVRAGGLLECERAKQRLSQVDRAEFALSDLKPVFLLEDQEVDLVVPISRAELDRKVEPLIDHTVTLCRKLVQANRDVSEILLVGGPTVMPIVREKLQTLGLAVNFRDIHPMTAVATGAALYAGTLPAPRRVRPRPAESSGAVSPVSIVLDYEPVSEFDDAPVIVRCTDPRAGWVQIESASGDWTSGRIPPAEAGHVLVMPLTQRGTNLFRVKCFSPTGDVVLCDPQEMSIISGVAAGAAPMPGSFRVELVDPDAPDKFTDEVLIPKGAPLPATGRLSKRTTVELSRASQEKVLIKIWEGDRRNLRSNQLAYSLELHGGNVPRKLPPGTEIEICLTVSASRIARAELHIPTADETREIPAVSMRFDAYNAKQLEERRRFVAGQIEEMEEAAEGEMKVALEVCRRRLFNDSFNRALATAREGGTEVGDAAARVDEAIRETEDELAGLREQQQEKLVPFNWKRECHYTSEAVESQLANTNDRDLFRQLVEQGETALQAQRWNRLKLATQEVVRLYFHIYGRVPGFWREWAKTNLPTDPEIYGNPQEAGQLLQSLATLQEVGALRGAVIRLHHLLPYRKSGAAGILPNLK
jgi:molecular chaperone DnaK